jgi:hypothetical protein
MGFFEGLDPAFQGFETAIHAGGRVARHNAFACEQPGQLVKPIVSMTAEFVKFLVESRDLVAKLAEEAKGKVFGLAHFGTLDGQGNNIDSLGMDASPTVA